MGKYDEVIELLQDIFGVDGANKYIKNFAGETFYTPKGIIVEQTHRKIREEFRNGASYRELKIKYGYTEQHIRRIIHYNKNE
jgi:Mor family transcriptional regulator